MAVNGEDVSWREYRLLVLAELERANQGVRECGDLIKTLVRRIEDLEREQAVAKAKAGAYGAIAGLLLGGIPAIISILMQ